MSPPKQALLYVLEGEDRGQKFCVSKPAMVIGRKEGDILLRDSKISARHARLTCEQGIYSIEDLESTNGTYVNGERIRSQILTDGAEIALGFTKLLFRLPKAKEAEEENGAAGDDLSFDSALPIEALPSLPLAGEPSQPQPKAEEVARPAPAPELALQVLNGAASGRRFPLQKENFVVGRLNCDLNLQDNDVSRKHALLELLPDGAVMLRDLSSTNGTYLNGQRINNTRLKVGDRIQLGRTVLLVVLPEVVVKE